VTIMMNNLSTIRNSWVQLALGLVVLAGLTGCQFAPPAPPSPLPMPMPKVTHLPPKSTPPPPAVVIERPVAPTSESPTTPQPEFGYPALVPQPLPPLPAPPQPQVVLQDGQDIPLVRQLMAQGLQQLQLKQWDNAEETYMHVQRIAPQYASVYARLSELALKRKEGAKAESMARRGLVLTKSAQQKSGFWQLIALAGAMQNKPDVVNEANSQLKGH
jgi:hypothetical protein